MAELPPMNWQNILRSPCERYSEILIHYCFSGIPIVSVAGAAGGYEISEQFKLDKHLATSNDYSYILTALKGLVSATNDANAKNTLEKISTYPQAK